MTEERSYDVAVVGAGIIGLAVAWRARGAGMSVLLVDRERAGAGTSRVAAGMLAPVAEADATERDLLALGLRSAAAWPRFAEEIEAVTGIDVGYRTCGTMLVARDRDGAEATAREVELRRRLDLRVDPLVPSQARRLEPALAPTLRAAAEFPDDHAVDPRRVCDALEEACVRAGVTVRAGFDVRDPLTLPAERVVIAAGPWAGALRPGVPVRPVKGQALLLRDPAGAGLSERVLRFEGGYLVPRGDGRYYLGATMEERGFDTTVTALAAYELLRDCAEVLPGVLELEIEELVSGLRPGTPDNAPIVGTDPRDPRLLWATGHFRNGVLLAPVTAELIAAALGGDEPDDAFSPARFVRVAGGTVPSVTSEVSA